LNTYLVSIIFLVLLGLRIIFSIIPIKAAKLLPLSDTEGPKFIVACPNPTLESIHI